jgi:hypothetical protein
MINSDSDNNNIRKNNNLLPSVENISKIASTANSINTALPNTTNTSPPPTSTTPGDQKGIVKNLRKGLLGWLYPDAHDTSENMGKGLEAYFDKSTGKWVFPGEVIIFPLYLFSSYY